MFWEAASLESEGGGAFEPPVYWNFPPFFTLQPVAETKQKQIKLWTNLVLEWAKATNTWSLAVDSFPFWENSNIRRRLSPEGQEAVLSELVTEKHAEWQSEGESQGHLRIMWRTVSEVADDLSAHASENHMIGNVYTLFELHSGEDAAGTKFHKMDPWLLRRAIVKLEEEGKAALFEGSTADSEGVKFFD